MRYAIKNMLDPRQDLKQDSMLWELVLNCATLYKDKQIYANLHGFRCAGSQLCIKNETLSFKFPSEYNDNTKQDYKLKYLTPYVKQLKELFKFVNEYWQNNKEELDNKDDYFTRDIFLHGYKD